MRGVYVAVCLLTLGFGLARPAIAQINPFRNAPANSLNNDDFDAIRQAANTLLNHEFPTVGETQAWQNPRSGSSGTVEIARAFKHASYGCFALDYTATAGGAMAVQRSRLNWCKTKAGWKIL
jgi:surface antigen